MNLVWGDFEMWCFARIATIYTIQKTWQTPREECHLLEDVGFSLQFY